MKALSILQPWATLIAIGAKRVETRSWPTRYRGALAIHASKRHIAEERLVVGIPPFTRVLRDHFGAASQAEILERLPHGAIIGTAWLDACLSTEVLVSKFIQPPLSSDELEFGDFSPGRYGWLLRDCRELPEPVPIKGARGLWEWAPEEVSANLQTAAI